MGPHDHQGLLSTERQLAMLDAYAGAVELSGRYRSAWRTWREKSGALEDFQNSGMASERELDLLRHQLQEIDMAQPEPDEENELEAMWGQLKRYRREEKDGWEADHREVRQTPSKGGGYGGRNPQKKWNGGGSSQKKNGKGKGARQ